MLSQPGLRNVNLQKARLLDRLALRNSEMAETLRALKLDWYTIRNQVDEEASTAEVFIYDEIGGSFGVDALTFIEELNEITAENIVVRINSPGGLLIDGIAIGSALAQHPSYITTRVDGIAASAASIIAISGDRVEMMDGSQMMIHDVVCMCGGNAKDMRETASWLEEQSNNVASMYAKRAGGDLTEWRARMLAETWMFADEAIELKLADGTYQRTKALPGKEEPMPEEPDEDEPDEENPEEEDANSPAAESDEDDEEEQLENLMKRPHRLTNRGFKYLGRNKAPSPVTDPDKSFADLLDAWS